jgi:hypothetical protein
MLLFTADALTGEWRLHPASPVCGDVRMSRSAGPFIRRGNQLIRPTQDCSRWYGYAMRFSEVTRLSENEYADRLIAEFKPVEFGRFGGVHAYDRSGKLEVIDGFKQLSRRIALTKTRR